MTSVAIIGAGQAGLQLAIGLRQAGLRRDRRLEPDAGRTSTTAG